MVFCIICSVYYKRKRTRKHSISSEHAAVGPLEDANIQEHAYDEIDENAVAAEITNQGVAIDQHNKSGESTENEACGEDVPGHAYLTPYQPIVHYPNAIYKNMPSNFDKPQCLRTSDRFVEKYENTIVFN